MSTVQDLRALWARRERIRTRYERILGRDFHPNQPRRPDGKWGSGGSSGGGGHYVAAPRTSAGDWSAADIAAVTARVAEEQDRMASRDDRLAEMWARQGFDGKPQVVTKAEFDALGADHVKVYRGLHGVNDGDGILASDLAEQFRSGDDPYPGLGLFGNGTYTDTDKTNAQEYAYADVKGNPGEVLSMALRPEARIAEYADLRKEAEAGLPDDVTAIVRDDPGKIATLLGYDAIHRREYYVVLNRTALIVQEG